MFPGFLERVEKEVKALADTPATLKSNWGGSPMVQCFGADQNLISTWIGASVHAGLGNFQKQLITKAEYEECGAEMLNKKWC